MILSTVECNGAQGDVSFYKAKQRLLLFVSVDTPQTTPGPPPGEKDCVSMDTDEAIGWEGIRIWDVTVPTAPKFVTAVRTDCGSHTHTTIPDDDNHRAMGFDVFSFIPDGKRFRARSFHHMNPQTQEVFQTVGR